MNKIIIALALSLLFASCNGTNKGNSGNSDSTAVASVDTYNSSDTQEPDSLFYPKPDALEGRSYSDQENMPVCFAFVGRFASYDELRQSPFYGYLCQRIPELSQCTEFTVNTTDKVDDVWMLIPTIENVWCKIKAFTPDMLIHQELTDDAKVYYTSENMKPILIHTSMENQGSIIVDYSASATDGEFGVNAALFCAPCHTEPEKELKLVTFDYGEDTVYVSIPTAVSYVSQGKWWKGTGNDLAVNITANGQVSIKDNNGKEIHCSYINYHHKKRSMMAVKTDDGKQRAVWEWELSDDEEGSTKLVLTQLNGTILPESNKQLFFIDPNKADSKN